MDLRLLILVSGLGLIYTLGSCKQDKWPCVDGSGAVVTETRDISDFTGVSNEMEALVYITQGAEFDVHIDAQENLMEEIKTRLNGNILEIYSEHCIDEGEAIKVYVTLPVLTSIDISGSGSVFTVGVINCASLNIDVSGSGSFTAIDSINADMVDMDISGSGSMSIQTYLSGISADISGSGTVTLSGSGNTLNLDISGSGKMLTFGFLSHEAFIEISGSGDIELNTLDLIDGEINGSGDVYYKNTPIINVDISGSGSLIHVP